MNEPAQRVLTVGRGRFDALSGELVLDGRTATLRPRSAAVLAHLVRNADRVVDKDELMRSVWPDVVVTEDSLVQCVKEIRQALGEVGRDWIRTVPRRGYAFVPPSAPAPSAAVSPVKRWRWYLPGALLLPLGLLIAGLMWPRAQAPSASTSTLTSIIVLPIVDGTRDARRQLAAEDLTETLANALGRLQHLTVIAPSTAFTYQGQPVDVRRVGVELGVRYVLQGSLRERGAQPTLALTLVADSGSATSSSSLQTCTALCASARRWHGSSN